MQTISHKIRKQKWKVSAPSANTAFQLRSKLHNHWDLLSPVFEKVFNKIADHKNIVRIPKIELSLKVNATGDIMSILPDLEQQLNEKLKPLLKSPNNKPSLNYTAEGFSLKKDNNYFDLPDSHFTNEERTSDNKLLNRSSKWIKSNEDNVQWIEINAEKKLFEALVYYLHSGSLPWYLANENSSDTQLKNIFTEQKDRLTEFLYSKHLPTSFWFRLFQLAGNSESIKIIEALINQKPVKESERIIELIEFIFNNQLLSRYEQLSFISHLLVVILRETSSDVEPDFSFIADSVMKRSENKLCEFLISMPSLLHVCFKQAIYRNIQKLKALDKFNTVFFINIENKEGFVSNNTEQAQKIDQLSLQQLITMEDFKSLSHDKGFDDSLPSNIMLYSGLILLHPFLSRLFENTGIKDKTSELKPLDMPKAAALLYFLATGSEDIMEYQLPFVKVLLGLSPLEQLPVAKGLLSAADKEEANAVLESVVKYWTALKNTSITGLRATFIQREGLLLKKDEGLYLKIERKAFDILLDQLPWSISVIKLPWMSNIIYTEW